MWEKLYVAHAVRGGGSSCSQVGQPCCCPHTLCSFKQPAEKQGCQFQEGTHALRGRKAVPFCLGKWPPRNFLEHFLALPPGVFDPGAELPRALPLSLWGQGPRKATGPTSVQVPAGHSVGEGRAHGEGSPVSSGWPLGHPERWLGPVTWPKCCSGQRGCDGQAFLRQLREKGREGPRRHRHRLLRDGPRGQQRGLPC